jgi:hypothetical protein
MTHKWPLVRFDASPLVRSLLYKPAFSRYRRPKGSPSPDFTIV